MLCFVFAALVVLLDQLFKRWIVITLTVGESSTLIPGLLDLLHVENSGAAFSILPNQRWLLAGIAFIAALILIAILLRYNEGFWGTLGLSAVLGGAVGNLIDRVFHGYVVDMFRTTFVGFAIFNIADIFITLGGITFCIFFIVTSARSGKNRKTDADPEQTEQAEQVIQQYNAADYHYDYAEEREEIDYDKLFYEEGAPQAPYPERSRAQPPPYYEYEPEPTERFDPPPYTAGFYEPVQEPVYYEPVPDPPTGNSSTLDALGALESELTEMTEDYDLDDLLREYGFEDRSK